jgi:hypothetical protein
MAAAVLPIATLVCSCATGSHDQPVPDAATMTRPDATTRADATPVLPPDAAIDAGCAIHEGVTPVLDGVDDIAAYPASQQLTPAAMLGADAAAIAWDRDRLYVTVQSPAFAAAYEPLHIYLEVAPTGDPVASTGKEYAGLIPKLPFSPTHLIAVRRVSDSGSGPYDGVFVPTNGYQTRTVALDTDTFSSSSALSVQVPWSAIGGCPTSLRIALHVVHAVSGNEWKDLVPSTHTPWQMPGGGFYEVDTTAPPDVTNWSLR